MKSTVLLPKVRRIGARRAKPQLSTAVGIIGKGTSPEVSCGLQVAPFVILPEVPPAWYHKVPGLCKQPMCTALYEGHKSALR